MNLNHHVAALPATKLKAKGITLSCDNIVERCIIDVVHISEFLYNIQAANVIFCRTGAFEVYQESSKDVLQMC